MKELDKSDLDLIKTGESGVRAVRHVECVHLARGSMKIATNAGVLLLICCRSSNG
jgi:hypothetical protein